MRKLLLLSSLLAGPAIAGDTVVAVLPFQVHSDDPAMAHLGAGAADMMVTDLQRGEGVRLVERTRLQSVLDELSLQHSDFADPGTAQRIGQGVGATSLVVGSVTITGDQMRLDARLIDVGSGESVLADQSEGDSQAFFQLERTLALRLLQRLEAELDADDIAYFEGGDPVAPRTRRTPPPTGGQRASIAFTKKVRRTLIWIDGQPLGEHRKRAPLPPHDVSVGPHEVALASDADAYGLTCYGVVDVPASGVTFEKLRDLCAALDTERPPPWTTVLRGALISVEGEDASAVSIQTGPVEHVYGPALLNLEPGSHSLILQHVVAGAGETWACSGTIVAEAGTQHRLVVNGGGCHGFHHGAVSPTIGPNAFDKQVRARIAAEKDRERQEREAAMGNR